MFEKEGKFIQKLVKKLNKIFLEGASEKMHKGQNDFVTDKDFACEEFLISQIKKHFPKDNIISEETNKGNTLSDRTWIIDPIDGTINYMNGLPECGIQVCFYAQGETQLACLSLPKLNEFYFAKNGNGAYLNGKQIVINKNVEIEDALITLGDGKAKNDIRKILNKKLLGTRYFGCSSFEFAKTASSSLAGYILITNNVWDYMPGMLLCKEAGATCLTTEFEGIVCSIAMCNENLAKFITRELKKIK